MEHFKSKLATALGEPAADAEHWSAPRMEDDDTQQPEQLDAEDQVEQLKMYALAKQANVGDVNTSRPGMFDFTGKAKWDAWDKMKGKGKDEAMQEYVDELMRQKGVYGDAAKAGSG